MKHISQPAKKRLITLAQLLQQYPDPKITSVKIAQMTGWTEATIRRDISLLELHSGISNGYETKQLQKAITQKLGIGQQETQNKLCIVGLARLGESMLDQTLFEGTGFLLTAGFDTNQNRLDLIKSPIPLFPTLDLETKIRSLKIQYAILAVSDEKAQFMCDRLISCGIKGILNYTNTILKVSPQVRLLNCGPGFMLTNLL